MSTCFVPGSPTRPVPWPWTSAHVGAAPHPGRRPSGGPGLRSTLMRASHGQRRTIASRLGPMPAGDHAAADHGGTSTRCARPATPSHSGVQRRTARRWCRGHRRPVRPDTRRPRTPGHRTPGHRTPGHRTREHRMSARPVGRTSPRPDRGRGQGNDGLAGIRTSSDRRHPLGGPTSPRVTATGGARPSPGRLRGDGTCDAALTAATGQLPSTARHQAAPRRIALLRRFRVESRTRRWRPSGT
jgi:hypothetical protein